MSPVNGWKNPHAEGCAHQEPSPGPLVLFCGKVTCEHVTYLASLLLIGICVVSICCDDKMMSDLVCASIHTSKVKLSVTHFPHL